MSNVFQMSYQMVTGVLHSGAIEPIRTPQDYQSPMFRGKVAELVMYNSPLPYGSVSSYPSQSHPITSTTGHSPRGHVKKQIRSTSHSHSTRRNYYYRKKRKYWTWNWHTWYAYCYEDIFICSKENLSTDYFIRIVD